MSKSLFSYPLPKPPGTGETNPSKIQKNVREAIDGQHSLFCLGFGFDVSYAFLEKMALENGGLARRIYEDSDSALQLEVPAYPCWVRDGTDRWAHPHLACMTPPSHPAGLLPGGGQPTAEVGGL